MDLVPLEIANKLKEKGFACEYPFTIQQVKLWLRTEHNIHVMASPHYFAGTQLCWDVDIISWHGSIKSARGVCGRYKLCNQANLAGIEYVVDRLN